MRKFKTGAFVHLNSGSPVLTVVANHPGGDVSVSWFNDLNEVDVMTASEACFYLSSDLLPIDIGN